MDRTINYNFDKKQAITLCKKAISGKMAIVKDGGDHLKCGTPPFMLFNIVINDNTIQVSGGGAGAMLGETAASEIEMAVEEYQQSHGGAQAAAPQATPQAAPQAAPAQQQNQSRALTPEDYLEYQNKAIALLKQYKELYDNEILSKEEFEAKKADVLNFINGMTKK